MNPLVLLALVGGGLYLATRKSKLETEIENIRKNSTATDPLLSDNVELEKVVILLRALKADTTRSPGFRRVVDDIIKIAHSNLHRSDATKIFEGYIARVRAENLISAEEMRIIDKVL